MQIIFVTHNLDSDYTGQPLANSERPQYARDADCRAFKINRATNLIIIDEPTAREVSKWLLFAVCYFARKRAAKQSQSVLVNLSDYRLQIICNHAHH